MDRVLRGALAAPLCAAAALSLLVLALPAAGEVTAEDMVRSAHGESAPAADPQGSVERATFTTAVIDREPQDDVATLSNDNTQVFFFTELLDFDGETLTHRWEWNGQVMAEVDIEVGSSRWRTWTSKNLEPSWIGEWTVSVVDGSERILSSTSFTYAGAEGTTAAGRKAPAAPAGMAPPDTTPTPAAPAPAP